MEGSYNVKFSFEPITFLVPQCLHVEFWLTEKQQHVDYNDSSRAGFEISGQWL